MISKIATLYYGDVNEGEGGKRRNIHRETVYVCGEAMLEQSIMDR